MYVYIHTYIRVFFVSFFLSRAGTRACSRELRDSRFTRIFCRRAISFLRPPKHMQICQPILFILLFTCSSGAASHPDTRIPSSCAHKPVSPPHPPIGKDNFSCVAPAPWCILLHHTTTSYDYIILPHHTTISYYHIILLHHTTTSYDYIILLHHTTTSYHHIIRLHHTTTSYYHIIRLHDTTTSYYVCHIVRVQS